MSTDENQQFKPHEFILSDTNNVLKTTIKYMIMILGLSLAIGNIAINILYTDIELFLETAYGIIIGLVILYYGYNFTSNHKKTYIRFEKDGVDCFWKKERENSGYQSLTTILLDKREHESHFFKWSDIKKIELNNTSLTIKTQSDIDYEILVSKISYSDRQKIRSLIQSSKQNV